MHIYIAITSTISAIGALVYLLVIWLQISEERAIERFEGFQAQALRDRATKFPG